MWVNEIGSAALELLLKLFFILKSKNTQAYRTRGLCRPARSNPDSHVCSGIVATMWALQDQRRHAKLIILCTTRMRWATVCLGGFVIGETLGMYAVDTTQRTLIAELTSYI